MGLTQEELGNKIGVSKSAIAKWETNGGLPDRNNLKKLSEIMNVSVDELYRVIDSQINHIKSVTQGQYPVEADYISSQHQPTTFSHYLSIIYV